MSVDLSHLPTLAEFERKLRELVSNGYFDSTHPRTRSKMDHQPFPKIPRLNRDIVITEKLDGTNAAVAIVPAYYDGAAFDRFVAKNPDSNALQINDFDKFLSEGRAITLVDGHAVFAQSRTRFITPDDDNYGFAGWVRKNAGALVRTLGIGTHFGEWWGAGIQRGYGLRGPDKRFSLFNTARWGTAPFDEFGIPGLGVVPVLYEGPFEQAAINEAADRLREHGSIAAPGYTNPEGIVVWHTAARSLFKVTLERDDEWKGKAAA